MASSSRKPYSATSFRKSSTLKPFYTGGPSAITKDGHFLLTSMAQDLVITHVTSGILVDRIRGDTEDLTAICLTPDSSTLILSSRSLSLRVYSLSFSSSSDHHHPQDPTCSHQLIRTIPTLHSSSLTLIVSDPSSNFIATGSTDGTTKVWDLKKGYCTHFFKSINSGVISSICWNTSPITQDIVGNGNKNKGKETMDRKMELIVGSVDGSIRIWDLLKSSKKENKPIQTLLNAHVSPVRGLGISSDGMDLLSGSRDKTIVRWRLKKSSNKNRQQNSDGNNDWTFQSMETITVGESIESLGFISNPNDGEDDEEDSHSYFWSGGEKGEVKIWSLPIISNSNDSIPQDEGLKLSFIQPDSLYSSSSSASTSQNKDSEESEEDTRAITEVHQVFSSSSSDPTMTTSRNSKASITRRVILVSVHSDQTIIFRNGPLFNQNQSRSSSSSRQKKTQKDSPIKPLEMIRQLIGFNDEIVDLTLLAPNGYSTSDDETTTANNQVQPMSSETHLAIATNSNYPRIYSLKTNENHVELLRGGKKPKDRHEDMILCLDSSFNSKWLVSGSKDKTARIWTSRRKRIRKDIDQDDDEEEGGRVEWFCNGIAEGHAESVGAVAMARRGLSNDLNPAMESNSPFMITGSSDKTIKLWDLTSLMTSSNGENSNSNDNEIPTPTKLKSLLTLKIHDKDINTLDISPNNALLISGSQDKTAKVFSLSFTKKNKTSSSIASLKQLAICSGHKRGVWSVKFSPIDAAFATSSGDKTIRLWSLKDFSCVKVFDSHSHSVLRIDFLNRGTQLLTAGAEGVVKLWNIRDEENVWNKEVLNDRIWGLKVKRGGKEFVVAGADGQISWWKDDTKEKVEIEGKKREIQVQQEQDFSNYLSIQDYKNAIALALNMNQPRRLFSLFSSVSSSRPDSDSMKSLIEEKDSKSKKKVKSSSIGRDDEPLGATQLLKNVLNLNLPNSSSNKSSKRTRELTLAEKSKLEDYHSITGSKAVDLIIKNLPKSQLNQLLIYIRDWNTSHKTSGIAQEILHAILRYRTSSEIREAFDNNERKFNLDDDDEEEEDEDRMDVDEDEQESKNQRSLSSSKLNKKNMNSNKRDGIPKVKDLGELLDGIIPYTQRHLSRSDRNLMEASVLDYTLKCMDQILGEDGDEDEEEDEEGSDEEEEEEEREVGMNGNGKINGIERVEVESEEDESEAESEDVEMRD